MKRPLIQVQNISKVYQSGDSVVRALDDISFSIHAGDFVAITGHSGSGKSTLMHILGCLDTPTDGTYHLNGKDIAVLSHSEQTHLRSSLIGFVFQRFHLLSTLTARENIALPLRYAGWEERKIQRRCSQLLADVQMSNRADHLPWQLSGGQQQRVAIARALALKPKLIIADEPTGNLDSDNGEIVMKLLEQLHTEKKTTLIIVTHEEHIASRAQSRIVIHDGKIKN